MNILELMLENKDFHSLIATYRRRRIEAEKYGRKSSNMMVYNMINDVLKGKLL